jgi:hypothetical protein
MMKDRSEKGLTPDRSAKSLEVRTTSLRYEMGSATNVADSSTQAWKKYCDCRLRQFASGR